ncbi:hypothetical protein [Rhodobacteraceae bacterium DSL-40]|uniref:hypothetical protein n=1 Tax=Amaricoccus sp. B4 TaxID=3368557 RepID=UPI0013A68C4F
MATTGEDEIAKGIMKFAMKQKDGIARFDCLYNSLQDEVSLTADDWRGSTTRNGEPMWHQIVRNVQSHHEVEGNAIYEGWLNHIPKVGYQITNAGRKYIASLG